MIRCQDAAEFLRSLDDKSYDAVVTSPPYNIGVDYDSSTDSREDYVEWSLQWIREAVRVARKGLMLNIGAKVSSQNQLYRLLGAVASEFVIQQTWIWNKSIHVAGKTYGHFKPVNSDRYCNNTHELVLLINRDGRAVLDKLAVGVPFEDKSNIARFAGNGGRDLRDRGSTWFLPYETRVEKLPHPATFPEGLAEMMIRVVGARSVVDPFVGSGTTVAVARRLGLEYAAADLSPEYVRMTEKRLENIIVKQEG